MGTKQQVPARSFASLGMPTAIQAHVFVALTLALLASPAAFSTDEGTVSLNNEGVTALKSNDYDTAISKLRLALKKTPGYKLAKENLVITYNNAGIARSKDTQECMKDFHMAVWLDPNSTTATENIDATIKVMKMDPKSVADRIALAEACEKDNDFAGAIVEYRAALKLKSDPDLQKKIDAIKVPDEWQKIHSAAPEAPTAKTPDVDFGPYMADLQRRIKKNWYPPKGNETRQTRIIFKVNKDGTISDLRIDKSSGVDAVDKAALEAARTASPVRPLPKGAPNQVDIQFTYDYNVFSNNKKRSDKEPALEERIENLEKLGKTAELAKALRELGDNNVEQDKSEEAIEAYKKALNLLHGANSDQNLKADIDEKLADIYYKQNQINEAMPLYREGLALYLKDSKISNTELAKAYNNLGFNLLHVDDRHTDEALENFTKGHENAEKDNDTEHMIDSNDGIAYCYFMKKEYTKARSLYEKVVSDTEKSEGKDSPNLMRRAKSIADCDYEMKNLKEALSNYKRAVSFSSTSDSDDNDELDEANQRIEEIASRLNLPGHENASSQKDTITQEDAKKEAQSSGWLLYAMAGSLLSLLIIFLVGKRQNSSVNLTGKNDSNK